MDRERKNYSEETSSSENVIPRTLPVITSRFKSLGRAIKRHHVTTWGFSIPSRPYNNRANSSDRRGKHSRSMNETKRRLYEQVKHW